MTSVGSPFAGGLPDGDLRAEIAGMVADGIGDRLHRQGEESELPELVNSGRGPGGETAWFAFADGRTAVVSISIEREPKRAGR